MKVLILVHSKTGNCYSLGQEIGQALGIAGHTADLVRLKAEPDNAIEPGEVRIRNLPDPKEYDAIIVGAPVRAFGASAVMQAAMSGLNLKGKRLALFVTMYMPFVWLGGNQAVRRLTALAADQGNAFLETQIIRLPLSARGALIESFKNRLVLALKR